MAYRTTTKVLACLSAISAALLASLLFAQSDCPQRGLALTAESRALAGLKNRARPPGPDDFDGAVTLDALLEPGDDRGRWSEGRAAKVEGYVVGVTPGGAEAANCYSIWERDTHIYLARGPEALPRERVVAEVTPRWREWARGQGYDWSEAALEGALTGRWGRRGGWLLFDHGHAGESENLSPGGGRDWRGTAWEIHPVTGITVLK